MDGQFNDKLKNILSDPESLKSIMSIASILGAQKNQTKESVPEPVNDEAEDYQVQNAVNVNVESEKEIPNIPSFSLPSIPSGKDDRIQLLLSIKPFLNDKKRTRVDGLVKALGAARIISSYKDSDLFG